MKIKEIEYNVDHYDYEMFKNIIGEYRQNKYLKIIIINCNTFDDDIIYLDYDDHIHEANYSSFTRLHNSYNLVIQVVCKDED